MAKVEQTDGLVEKLVAVDRVAKVVKVVEFFFHRINCCW